MKIWIVVITTADNQTVYASPTEQGAIRQVADWCENNWDVPDEIRSYDVPETDSRIIAEYFGYHEDTQSCYWHEVELV